MKAMALGMVTGLFGIALVMMFRLNAKLDGIRVELLNRPVTREIAIGPGASMELPNGLTMDNPGTNTAVIVWYSL